MMQDKNNLDDMTKKYKEEMMRLYNRKPKPVVSVPPPRQEVRVQTTSDKETSVNPTPVRTADESARTSSEYAAEDRKRPARTSAANTRDLSNPPMPEIPTNYSDAGVKKTETKNVYSSKFPSAGEIMRNENNLESLQMHQPVTVNPEAHSVLAEEHNQGNYTAADSRTPQTANMDSTSGGEQINESYPDENTDFSAVDSDDIFSDGNPSDMSGQGYLQIEVTTASGAVPVRDATVIVTEKINGADSLIGMVVTDENGATPIIPLPAPPQSLSESPDPLEKPYSEYNISVYKKGFYSVPKLTVPIFDTIKSIQPVSVIPLAEFELSGAEIPNERR